MAHSNAMVARTTKPYLLDDREELTMGSEVKLVEDGLDSLNIRKIRNIDIPQEH